MKIKGSDFPAQAVDPKCASKYANLVKKKKVDLDATGDPKTNLLVEFLTCQAKTGSTTTKLESSCQGLVKEYKNCHSSVMGVGVYKGQRHCGTYMTDLYQCLAA